MAFYAVRGKIFIMSGDKYKKCPYCGEEIKVVAETFRYWESYLVEEGFTEFE